MLCRYLETRRQLVAIAGPLGRGPFGADPGAVPGVHAVGAVEVDVGALVAAVVTEGPGAQRGALERAGHRPVNPAARVDGEVASVQRGPVGTGRHHLAAADVRALHGHPAPADRPEHAGRRFAVGIAGDAEVEVRLVVFGEVEQALSVRAQVRHGEERVEAGGAAAAIARTDAIGVEAAGLDARFAAANCPARAQHHVDDGEERAGAVERRARAANHLDPVDQRQSTGNSLPMSAWS